MYNCLHQLEEEWMRWGAHIQAVLVRVTQTQGSVPREQGAWMVVFEHATINTIGGGHLEWQVIAKSRELLRAMKPTGQSAAIDARYTLGSQLGQCCGGVVQLRFEGMNAENFSEIFQSLRAQAGQQTRTLALFGGGHVGCALVKIFGDLPYRVLWIDSRDEIFPENTPINAHCEHSTPAHDAVQDVPPHSQVLIMSFSHAEDLEIVAACLQRQRMRGDLAFIGLIGSATKWASFRHRLQLRGFTETELAQVTSPIGLLGITGKTPAEIAVSVAAQLLQLRTPMPAL